MRKVGIALAIFFASALRPGSGSSTEYWQQRVAYKIQATLNDSTRVITGVEKLVYWNNSPDTLRFVYFHAYPNAHRPGSRSDKRARSFYNFGLADSKPDEPARLPPHLEACSCRLRSAGVAIAQRRGV